jgi:hypothetical protein
MDSIALGFAVEVMVAILLVLTIGYCIVLNKKLKSLHGDKDALKQMVVDLVKATNMANSAVKGLRQSASEADNMLEARLSEANKFTVELANHINAGHGVLEKISRITSEASKNNPLPLQKEAAGGNEALQRLKEFQRRRENAA